MSLAAETQKQDVSLDVEELKARIEKYFKGHGEALPSNFEVIFHRKLRGKHVETDVELMEELRMKPLNDANNRGVVESDFEELYETDEEIDDLYSARDPFVKKIVKDEILQHG